MLRRTEQSMSDVAHTLHEIIKESPGIHFRSLGRQAGLSSVGQLRHHLDSLRRQGAIIEVEDGRFKRFFAAGEHDPRLRDGLARFARRVPRRIAKLLLSRTMNRTEIRRSLNCADSTLGYHLNRMVELGDLKRTRGRNCCIYSLTDPEFVRTLLQHHPGPAADRPGERAGNGHGPGHRPWVTSDPGRGEIGARNGHGNGHGANGHDKQHGPAGNDNGSGNGHGNGRGHPRAPVPREDPKSNEGVYASSSTDRGASGEMVPWKQEQPPRRSTDRPSGDGQKGVDRKDPGSRPGSSGPVSVEKEPNEGAVKKHRRSPRGLDSLEEASEVPGWLLSG